MKTISKALFAASFALATVNAFADTIIRNVEATNCEIFVDKAVGFSEVVATGLSDRDHVIHAADFFIKINPSRLDGSVNYVAWEGDRADLYSNQPQTHDAYRLKNFANSSDYFSGPSFLTYRESRYGSALQKFTGRFYVETDAGTRYWSQSSVGNLVIDDDLAKTLPIVSVAQALKTADMGVVGTYLNPGRCR